MKRDPTVLASLVMLAGAWVASAIADLPRSIAVDVVVLGAWALGCLRAVILWFQTLMHGVDHARPENRVAVVLGHLFLGPIMSYAYYYSSRHWNDHMPSE